MWGSQRLPISSPSPQIMALMNGPRCVRHLHFSRPSYHVLGSVFLSLVDAKPYSFDLLGRRERKNSF